MIIDHDTDNYLLDVNKENISVYCTIIAFHDKNLLDVNKNNFSVFCGIIAFCEDQFSWIVVFLCVCGDQILWIRRFTVLKGKLYLLNSVFVKNVKFLFTGYT